MSTVVWSEGGGRALQGGGSGGGSDSCLKGSWGRMERVASVEILQGPTLPSRPLSCEPPKHGLSIHPRASPSPLVHGDACTDEHPISPPAPFSPAGAASAAAGAQREVSGPRFCDPVHPGPWSVPRTPCPLHTFPSLAPPPGAAWACPELDGGDAGWSIPAPAGRERKKAGAGSAWQQVGGRALGFGASMAGSSLRTGALDGRSPRVRRARPDAGAGYGVSHLCDA